MPELCQSFRWEAGRVWNDMEHAKRLGLSFSEETITETCLLNIAKRQRHSSIAIIPATKPQEAKHGADWEWWFTKAGVGVGYRVQAKRLYPSGRYQELFKSGDKFEQLDKLVSRGAADDLDPLYCFYNYDSPTDGFSGCTNRCRCTGARL